MVEHFKRLICHPQFEHAELLRDLTYIQYITGFLTSGPAEDRPKTALARGDTCGLWHSKSWKCRQPSGQDKGTFGYYCIKNSSPSLSTVLETEDRK